MDPSEIQEFRDNQFFKFLFFDPYLREGKGANSFAIAHLFAQYLSSPASGVPDNSVSKLFQSSFFDESNRPVYSEIYSPDDELERTTRFIAGLETSSGAILLGGWQKRDGGGHAVVYYINYEKDNSSLYIVNSGDGVENHGAKQDGLTPVIILYKNVHDEQLRDFYAIHLFLSKVYGDRDEELAKLKDYKRHPVPPNLPLVYYKYITSPSDVGADHLYGSVGRLFERAGTPVVYDKTQLSGSCTFFSIHHFIKHAVFSTIPTQAEDHTVFNRFIQQVKKSQMSLFFKQYYPYAAEPDCDASFRSDIINITLMLLKDEPLAETIAAKAGIRDLSADLISLYGEHAFSIDGILPGKPWHGQTELEGRIQFYKSFSEKADKGVGDIIRVAEVYRDSWNPHSPVRAGSATAMNHYASYLMLMKSLIMIYDSIKPTLEITDFYKTLTVQTLIMIRTKLEGPALNIALQSLLKQFTISDHGPINGLFAYNGASYNDDEIKRLINLFSLDANSDLQTIYNFNFRRLYVHLLQIRNILCKPGRGWLNLLNVIKAIGRSTANLEVILKATEKPTQTNEVTRDLLIYSLYRLEDVINSINAGVLETLKGVQLPTGGRGDPRRLLERIVVPDSSLFGHEGNTDLLEIYDAISEGSVLNVTYESSKIYDSVEMAIRRLDLANFESSMTSISEDLLDYLIYFLYLYRRDEITERLRGCMIAALPEQSVMSPFLNRMYNSAHAVGGQVFTNLFMVMSIEENIRALYDLTVKEIRVLPDYTIVLDNKLKALVGHQVYKSAEGSLWVQKADGTMESIILEEGRYGRIIDGQVAFFKGDEPPPLQSRPVDPDAAAAAEAAAWSAAPAPLASMEDLRAAYRREAAEADASRIRDDPIKTKLQMIGMRLKSLYTATATEYLMLEDLPNAYFIRDTDKTVFIDKGETYSVVTDLTANPLLGIWMQSMTNTFIIKKDNTYLLLVIINNNYINSRKIPKTDYWGTIANSGEISRYNEFAPDHAYHLLPLHHTFTSVTTSDYNSISGLYLSLLIAKNTLGLYLMWPAIRNRVLDNNLPENPLYLQLDKLQMDTPLWPLYESLFEDQAFEERKEYFKRSQHALSPAYDLNSIAATNSGYGLIKRICEKFQSIKATIATDDLIGNIALQKFIQEFRYRCEQEAANCSSNNVTTLRQRRSPPVFLPETAVRLFKSLLFKNGELPSISSFYVANYLDLYSNLINLLYNEMSNRVIALTPAELACASGQRCGLILKILEPLDIYLINPLTEQRGPEELLFELQNRLFLRRSQKRTLGTIYADIDNAETRAYEILMGAGKTTTLTPMTILRQYLTQPKITQYIVVLPSHLVPTSFDILCKLTDLMPNFIIKSAVPSYRDHGPVLHVVSIDAMKLYTLKRAVDGARLRSNNNMILFDEVDSLLNPLKSDLNIPVEPVIQHPHIEIITAISIEVLHNYRAGVKVAPVANASINIGTATGLLYSGGTSVDATLAPVLVRKLNAILKQVIGLQYNRHYGFGELDKNLFDALAASPEEQLKLDVKGRFTAIPYSANRNPVKGSEFTDFELLVMLTIRSYQETGIRADDVALILYEIYQKAHQITGEIADLIIEAYNGPVTAIIPLEAIKTVLYYLKRHKSKEAMARCGELATMIQESTPVAFFNFYLNLIFRRFFGIKANQDNISTVDLFNRAVSGSKVSFSGTVNFNSPGDIISNQLISGPIDPKFSQGQINSIVADRDVGVAIEAAFYGKTTTPPFLKFYNYALADRARENELLQYLIESFAGERPYSALIDTAGLILLSTPNQVMKLIAAALPPTTKLLYIENGIKWIYSDKPTRYREETFKELFIYYDHKNCVGADFKQPHRMHGLVTLMQKNNLTELAQGIFRLRNINVGHSIDFYLPEGMIHAVDPVTDAAAIYALLKSADEEFKITTLATAKLQCAKYVNRVVLDNAPISYREPIYFDTIQINGVYETQQTFVDGLLAQYDPALLGTAHYMPIMVNPSSGFVQTAVAINMNIAVETAIEIQIERASVLQPMTEQSMIAVSDVKADPPYYCGIVNDLASWTNYKSVDQRLVPYTDLLTVRCGPDQTWSLSLSNMLMQTLSKKIFTASSGGHVEYTGRHEPGSLYGENEQLYFLDRGLYFFYNPAIPNSLLLASYVEFYTIRKRYIADPTLCFAGITVFDKFGRVQMGPDLPNPLPLTLIALLMPGALTIVERFMPLKQLFVYNTDARLKMEFFNRILEIDHRVFIESTGWSFDQATDPQDFGNWERLLGLHIEDSTDELRGRIQKSLLEKFAEVPPLGPCGLSPEIDEVAGPDPNNNSLDAYSARFKEHIRQRALLGFRQPTKAERTRGFAEREAALEQYRLKKQAALATQKAGRRRQRITRKNRPL